MAESNQKTKIIYFMLYIVLHRHFFVFYTAISHFYTAKITSINFQFHNHSQFPPNAVYNLTNDNKAEFHALTK